MRKFAVIILIVLYFAVFFPGFSSAAEFVEFTESAQPEQNFGQDEVAEALPEEARDAMEGIDPVELSFGEVASEIWELLKREITAPLKMFISLAGVIILCAAAETLRDSGDGGGLNTAAVQAFQMAGVLAGAGIMSGSIAECVVRTSETITAAGAFMLTFIPVLAGIMAVMGQVASANLFNASVVAAAQIFSQIMAAALMPLSASVLGISIAGAISPDLKTERLANTVKTVVVWALGFLTVIFTGLLTVQSLVSGNADSVAMKAVKFTVSGGIPFIGGTVSDALGVVNGSVSILKSATGSFGIVAICVVCLPSLLSAVCFRIALSLAAAVVEIFGVKQLGSLLKSGENVLSIIIAMIVCFMLIMLVSTALMIKIGGA